MIGTVWQKGSNEVKKKWVEWESREKREEKNAVLRIRIRIDSYRFESRIRIRVKIKELFKLNIELWRAVDANSGGVEA